RGGVGGELMRGALLALALLVAACGLPPSGPAPDPGDPGPGDPGPIDPGPGRPTALFLVDAPGSLNPSEQRVKARLEANGFGVELVDDDGFAASRTAGCRLIVMSKTVTSTNVGNKLKGARCGVIFWEDNQQKLDMLATIANDGSGGTGWHATGNDVHVRAEAPADLRAGLAGRVDFYSRNDEITYAPGDDLAAAGIVIAEFEDPGGPPMLYVFERNATLADGSRAAGRRLYFGLYDDTFQHLTADGLRLFDAAVAWAAN
ncbi:MAG: hypothetical protein ABR559_01610, partial [Gemmatimonadota bacterium]